MLESLIVHRKPLLDIFPQAFRLVAAEDFLRKDVHNHKGVGGRERDPAPLAGRHRGLGVRGCFFQHGEQFGFFALACATEPDGGMDTLPTVIVEAMAAALPVVSTRLAAIPEMVTHGETGLLVEEKQPAALADALETLLRNPTLAERFGACGKTVAADRFAADVTVGQLRKLLEQAG